MEREREILLAEILHVSPGLHTFWAYSVVYSVFTCQLVIYIYFFVLDIMILSTTRTNHRPNLRLYFNLKANGPPGLSHIWVSMRCMLKMLLGSHETEKKMKRC